MFLSSNILYLKCKLIALKKIGDYEYISAINFFNTEIKNMKDRLVKKEDKLNYKKMKSLEQNITYQILKLRLEQIKNLSKTTACIKKYNYGEEAKKFQLICRSISNQLKLIEKDLRAKLDSLELTSSNLEEIENITTILLEFKEYDETILYKIESKILELTQIKEEATKNYDFKTANVAREEARQLQKYYNSNKKYLKNRQGIKK